MDAVVAKRLLLLLSWTGFPMDAVDAVVAIAVDAVVAIAIASIMAYVDKALSIPIFWTGHSDHIT